MQAVLRFPDLDPAVFSVTLFGLELSLRWYALAYIAGIAIGWRLLVLLMRRDRLWPGGTAPMPPARVEDLATGIILGIILGGRLGFVLFYQPGYYLAHPAAIPAVWQGGMSFHGGLIGVTVAVLWFCRRNGVALLSAADGLAMGTPPGLLLGRLANFVNGELWGRPSELPWAVIFPGPLAQACPPGWQGPCARHPSQLYEAALEGLLLGAVVLWLGWRRGWLRAPGRITGVFTLGYGLARFVVEYFREPDAQFITPANPAGHVLALGPAGVTMGQLLSLPLIALGAALIARSMRRARPA